MLLWGEIQEWQTFGTHRLRFLATSLSNVLENMYSSSLNAFLFGSMQIKNSGYLIILVLCPVHLLGQNYLCLGQNKNSEIFVINRNSKNGRFGENFGKV